MGEPLRSYKREEEKRLEETGLPEKMKLLIGLQACDQTLRKIRSRVDSRPSRVKELEERLVAAENRLREDQDQFEKTSKERRNADREIEAIESKINKSREKLAAIKSNKEYRAVLKEIEDLEAQKLRLEDHVIELMEKTEGLQVRDEAAKREFEEVKETCEKEKEEILKEIEMLDRELIGVQKEREGFCAAIDEDLLRNYVFLTERKGGIAVSSVVKGVCQTCNMGIPPQQFNELMRGEMLLTCPNCQRIIYWGDDERYQTTSEGV
jgi:predicted  nucleic acid-binding Zn-ribbon protein